MFRSLYRPLFRELSRPIDGGNFQPRDLPGNIVWLDAADTDSIIDTAGAVSEWRDKSGSNNHATQGTGANHDRGGPGARQAGSTYGQL